MTAPQPRKADQPVTTQPHPYPAMTAEQHRAYAADLIEGASEVEFMTVIEAAGASDHVPGGEISEADAQAVHDLALRAQIAVTWPDVEVTAQPAAEQAEPTTITTPVEIGVHDLAVGELAQQVYAIAHDVDRDLVEPHHDGVPEILALLQTYEDGLLASPGACCGHHEVTCPGCGTTIRARMADATAAGTEG